MKGRNQSAGTIKEFHIMTEKPLTALSLHRSLKALTFGLVLASAPVALSQSAQASSKQAAANFVTADANGDGALTQAEFKSFINLNAAHGIGKAQTVKDRGLYDRAFARLDLNRDGRISSAELQSAGR